MNIFEVYKLVRNLSGTKETEPTMISFPIKPRLSVKTFYVKSGDAKKVFFQKKKNQPTNWRWGQIIWNRILMKVTEALWRCSWLNNFPFCLTQGKLPTDMVDAPRPISSSATPLQRTKKFLNSWVGAMLIGTVAGMVAMFTFTKLSKLK